MKQTSSLHTAVITKGLRRGSPGPGPVIMSIIIWPMAGPLLRPGCLKSWPLDHTHNTRSVEFRDNSVSSGIFICHIMFQFRRLFDLSERANWFIWPTPLHSAPLSADRCLPNVQCAVTARARLTATWSLDVVSREEGLRLSCCHVSMS